MLGGVLLESGEEMPKFFPREWLDFLIWFLALLEKTSYLSCGIAGEEPIIYGMAEHFPQRREDVPYTGGCQGLPLSHQKLLDGIPGEGVQMGTPQCRHHVIADHAFIADIG